MSPFRLHILLLTAFCAAGGTLATGSELSSRAVSPAGFAESDLLGLLTRTLQSEQVRDRGELELRALRPWTTLPVAPETVSLRIVELPTAGVSGQFIARFELFADGKSLGSFQTPLQARVWREVWVARSALARNQVLREEDVALERRDILGLRQDLVTELPGGLEYEIREYVPAGAPLLARAVKPRPVVRRGQAADAYLEQGALRITMKVEVLEDGAPGQVVRLRNLQSRREFRGIVQNESTIVVPL